jgi:hypothetical protein
MSGAMPLYRVRAYDSEHHATLLIAVDRRERAGVIACDFVEAMHLGTWPADHSELWPEIVRVELARSWFEADEDFAPIVESVEEIDPDTPGEA